MICIVETNNISIPPRGERTEIKEAMQNVKLAQQRLRRTVHNKSVATCIVQCVSERATGFRKSINHTLRNVCHCCACRFVT